MDISRRDMLIGVGVAPFIVKAAGQKTRRPPELDVRYRAPQQSQHARL